MAFLSPDIEMLAKRIKLEHNSLIRKQNSCGIFQDYGDYVEITSVERTSLNGNAHPESTDR